jgi:hypothetical protein
VRGDFAAFAQRAFHELYPRSQFLMNWHNRVIAARLAAVRDGDIRWLAVNLPPRPGVSERAGSPLVPFGLRRTDLLIVEGIPLE